MDGLSEYQAGAARLRRDRDAAVARLHASVIAASSARDAVEQARTAPQRDDQGAKLREALAAQQSAEAVLAQYRNAMLSIEGRLGEWIGGELSDPRRRIEGLSDHIPILLFPVRIETRFFGAPEKPELRVRIFPDDIAVSTHETALSAGEASAGRTFWVNRAVAMHLADAEARDRLIEGAWTRLVQDHGEQRGSFILIRLKPLNWDDATPPLAADLVFPDIGPELPATNAGTVPRSRVMPDRFVIRTMLGDTIAHEVMGEPVPDDLLIGPDPKQLETVLLRDSTTGRLLPDARIAWLFDFEAAEKVGLAVRIPLEPSWLRTGFSRIVALGLKLSADAAASASLVEGLVEGFHYTCGFDILPQGTPTNNTERVPAGFSSDPRPTPTVYERIVLGKTATIAAQRDRSDAEYLSSALDIAFDSVKALPNAPQKDIGQAFAMNRALWSATIGGYLDKIIPSALPATLDAAIRAFFLNHVTGRGTIPAIRAGRQPYGVVVTSALEKWQVTDVEARLEPLFAPALLKTLKDTYQFWRSLAAAVPHVRLDDSDHSAFMSVIGLQASSALYGARKGVTDTAAWNWLQFDSRLVSFANNVWDALRTARLQALARLGFDVTQPDLKLAQIAFLSRFEMLDGPVIDGDPALPLSEKATIAPFDSVTKQNYIHWLATSDAETIKAETFKLANGTTVPPPKALLYKYLRHALLAEAATSAITIAKLRIPALAALTAVPTEPDIVNVGATRVVTAPQMLGLSASRLGLTRTEQSLGGYVLDRARDGAITPDDPPDLQTVADLFDALKRLAVLPTAVLERLFAEHIDLGSYRLDAWITGLFDRRLRGLRNAQERERGIYLGAYGYVEDLKPKSEQPTLVNPESVPPELREDTPVVSRASNAGFVHAPSLSHGVTAAVLRNAYISHADQANADAMSINLSSHRVRAAMDYVEGIRNGQELAALLGYQLERGLHENHPGLELDEFIYVLRDRFPFVSKKISPVPDGTATEVTEARNVVNGYDLLAWVKDKTYPYAIAGLPTTPSEPANAIMAEIDRLADAMDSLGDLMMAESVHQVAQGNYDRARSVLQALGEGEVPPVPDVVATPRSGRMLVQRIAIHCPNGRGWTGDPPTTPRAAAAPRLNHWLTLQLPDPATIQVTFTLDSVTRLFSLGDTGLDALDIVLMCTPSLGDGAGVLERFLVDRYRSTQNIPEDARLFFKLKNDPSVPDGKALIFDPAPAGAGGIGLETVWPLLNHLRDLVARARPLDASDYRTSTDKNVDTANPQGFDGAVAALAGQAEYVARVTDTINGLSAATDALALKLDEPTLKARIDALFAEPPVFIAAEWTTDLRALRMRLRRLALFGFGEALPASVTDPVAAEAARTAARALVTQAQTVLDLARKRVAIATAAAAEPPVTPTPADPAAASFAAAAAIQGRVDRLGRALKAALGPEMPATPLFGLSAARAAELAAGIIDPIAPEAIAVETWLQSLSRVRDSAATLAWIACEREWLLGSSLIMVPIQAPRFAGDPWIGGALGAARLQGDVLSVMTVTPPADPAQPLSGLVIDDWSELVPGERETTGLAFHFDRPNACAPQALLLAVSPTLNGAWEWSDLVATVTETFDRAKIRAVEPDQLIGTDYFHALPSTLVEFSSGRMYLSTVLAENALTLVSSQT